jgi:DNA-binding GntR family transcriptional regulator
VEQSTTALEPISESSSAASPDQEIRLRTVSVVDAAADALRQMVLDGTLEPGARLRETDFSKRLGIARHTFRAATQILINEGLLRRSPNRGVQLAVLDGDDIIDIFRLREALEIEAIRLVVTGEREIPEAEQAVERFNALGDDASWRTVVDLDMDFHRAVIDAADSQRINRAYAGVQSEILLCMAQLRPHYDRPAEVAAEHRELLTAIESGDLKVTEELFRKHLGDATENLTKALEAREEVTA